jgi:hypothetical protein
MVIGKDGWLTSNIYAKASQKQHNDSARRGAKTKMYRDRSTGGGGYIDPRRKPVFLVLAWLLWSIAKLCSAVNRTCEIARARQGSTQYNG